MSGPASHSSAVLASRAHLLYLVSGKRGGKAYWAYALIDGNKLAAFKKALAAGNIRVQDFGKVLEWGEGDAPPEQVKQSLKQRYNYDLIA
jgi:hypothetical protein